MPWTVRLEDEHGIPETKEFLVVEFGSLPSGEAYPISSLIESAPHYDTLLKPVQVRAFIAKIDGADPECSEALAPLRDLCSHWAHSFPVKYNEQIGHIELPQTICMLIAASSSLLLQLQLQEDANRKQMGDVLEEHLRRFAKDEEINLQWRRR
jgi:uncharacterized protein